MSNIGLSAVFLELWGAFGVLQSHWRKSYMSSIGLPAVVLERGVSFACFEVIGGICT